MLKLSFRPKVFKQCNRPLASEFAVIVSVHFNKSFSDRNQRQLNSILANALEFILVNAEPQATDQLLLVA